MFSLRCASARRIPLCVTARPSRGYAISVKPGRPLPNNKPRVFKDKKAFQFDWYTRMIQESSTTPLIFLYREDFTAERLQKLRVDLQNSTKSLKRPPSLKDPKAWVLPPPPTLTVIRSSIFGVALRNYPGIDLATVERMTEGVKGGYAALSLPVLDPPYLTAVLKALERSVPPRPPKTQEEIAKEEVAKNADPVNPGRRMKRSRPIRVPDMKVLGALVEGRILLAEGVKEVSKLPTLDTLRAQIVGVLSAPSSQLAAVLAQASGGQLARTLEGFKKGLEDQQSGGEVPPPPSS